MTLTTRLSIPWVHTEIQTPNTKHQTPNTKTSNTTKYQGRVLYESLANRVHPLGAFHHDITFSDVYAYLNCLEISPCSGWMNSNATLRNATTARAVELSEVCEDISLNNNLRGYSRGAFPPGRERSTSWWIKEGRTVQPRHPRPLGEAVR